MARKNNNKNLFYSFQRLTSFALIYKKTNHKVKILLSVLGERIKLIGGRETRSGRCGDNDYLENERRV